MDNYEVNVLTRKGGWKKLPQDGHIQRHNKTGKSNCDATIHPQQSLLVDLAENLV